MDNNFRSLRPDIQKIIDDFVKFRIQYCLLESNYRGIQEDHRLDIANINQTNADQISRMEEEIEILRSQLAGVEELHREEIINIRMKYEREKSNYQRTISTLKKQIHDLQTALEKSVELNSHPAFQKSTFINQSQLKKMPSIFKWPSLEIKKSSITTQDSKKKRKLYSIEEDAVVDIPPQ
ncbi:hypothetical protein PV327_009190 [Microctonus hyperodae]|uniref:Uncharacterized protein n=1 Tax=Microctonus hyperodae TaxID=165561 RepID=A0AA39FTA1_MICHY|nr:hypothetical protein PV327_009190 [Microctonus hyperodae]